MSSDLVEPLKRSHSTRVHRSLLENHCTIAGKSRKKTGLGVGQMSLHPGFSALQPWDIRAAVFIGALAWNSPTLHLCIEGSFSFLSLYFKCHLLRVTVPDYPKESRYHLLFWGIAYMKDLLISAYYTNAVSLTMTCSLADIYQVESIRPQYKTINLPENRIHWCSVDGECHPHVRTAQFGYKLYFCISNYCS